MLEGSTVLASRGATTCAFAKLSPVGTWLSNICKLTQKLTAVFALADGASMSMPLSCFLQPAETVGEVPGRAKASADGTVTR